MVKSTLIFRYDNLPLSGSVDDDNEPGLIKEKKNIKLLMGKLSPNSEPQATIESEQYAIHYLIDNQIYYFVITDKSYPRKLAFAYLTEVSTEFYNSHGQETLNNLSLRPYAFINFDNFLSKTKKIYLDQRTQSNLDRINNDLNDVKKIMSKNIEDLLYRGDSLDKMSHMSESLKSQSLKYRKAAQKINFELLIRQYAPVAVVSLFAVFLIWYMFF
ncbi:SNAP receptor [Saccharomycopsis crataegensis]|uniref:Protein transport protein SEC22 n=1 Tax=Saccharomycopsis crataegensis TaxID=43959 RepID=A0AAV5QUX0_9ASCO|nr:SNAP receptor [Saccharomycopsis crataegensis]